MSVCTLATTSSNSIQQNDIYIHIMVISGERERRGEQRAKARSKAGVIIYGLETVNPYNGHQRRERERESKEQKRGAKLVIPYGLETVNPYNGHQRRQRERESKEQKRGAKLVIYGFDNCNLTAT